MAGYSGTPLAKKLSLKDGYRAWFADMPDSVREEIGRENLSLDLLDSPEPPVEAAHLFVTHCATLDCKLRMLLPLLARDGFVWISWPKQASKVATDITEDVIRAVALPLGLVDVKVCAVDAIWSGLKLVIRKELRYSTCEWFALSTITISMIVCVCNRLTEKDVRQAVRCGGATPEAAYACLGCDVQCGCCLDYAQEIIDSERGERVQLRIVPKAA